MFKSNTARMFLGAMVVLAGGAVAAVAMPETFRPAISRVQGWTKSPLAKATVRGQLRLDGAMMPYTRIEVHTPQGVYATVTDPNGNYQVHGVPAGAAQVSIHGPEALSSGSRQEAEPEAPAMFPTRYRSSTTSGVTLNLAAGDQVQNIELAAH